MSHCSRLYLMVQVVASHCSRLFDGVDGSELLSTNVRLLITHALLY